MSNAAGSLTTLRPRTWIALILADAALFVLANLTANSSGHPGTPSNVLFAAFVIAAVLLVALAIVTVIRSRRGAPR